MPEMMKIGQRILRRYVVQDLLGDGGQASIAKGINRKTGEPVVIKQLSTGPEDPNYAQELARFQRAGNMRIGHPAVVDPIDCNSGGDDWYIVMPFIEGEDLEQYVHKNGGKLRPEHAAAIIKAIAEGISAIHRRQVVHRDIKPVNIIIDPQGRPHILDLGICKDLGKATITKNAALLGTLPWIAPEQLSRPGSEDLRCDLYALGTIFYFLLTGRLVVKSDLPGPMAMDILQWTPPSPVQLDRSIPKPINSACMQLLEKDRQQRPQSADEFLQALDNTRVSTARSGLCASCGFKGSSRDRFCNGCGADLLGVNGNEVLCLACARPIGQLPKCPGCSRTFSTNDHRILFQAGPLTGKTFRVPEGIYEIGRNELAPRDQHLSRRHFLVACVNGHFYVQDAGSANKTYVDQSLAELPTRLLSGQELRLADNTAIYISN